LLYTPGGEPEVCSDWFIRLEEFVLFGSFTYLAENLKLFVIGCICYLEENLGLALIGCFIYLEEKQEFVLIGSFFNLAKNLKLSVIGCISHLEEDLGLAMIACFTYSTVPTYCRAGFDWLLPLPRVEPKVGCFLYLEENLE
jgi:hypothetical protein